MVSFLIHHQRRPYLGPTCTGEDVTTDLLACFNCFKETTQCKSIGEFSQYHCCVNLTLLPCEKIFEELREL